MDLWDDLWTFACGITRRFYYWLWSFLLDPLDLYNSRIRHWLGKEELDMPSEYFPFVLCGGLLLSAFMVYREERARARALEITATGQTKTLRPLEWPPLTDSQVRQIRNAIKDWGSKPELYVACGGSDCAGLADGFAKLFRDLGWPTQVGSGGFFGAGQDGIVVQSGDMFGELLKSAVEDATGWEVTLQVASNASQQKSPLTMLIIGRKAV